MFKDTIQSIESPQFAARFGFASDLPSFTNALARDDTIAEVIGLLSKDSECVDLFIQKIRDLSGMHFDSCYENPNDIPIAAYGWALVAAYPEISGVIADLLSTVANSWWSGKLAAHIRQRDRQTDHSAYNTYVVIHQNAPNVRIYQEPFADTYIPAKSSAYLRHYKIALAHQVVVKHVALDVDQSYFSDELVSIEEKDSSTNELRHFEFIQ